MAIEMLRVRTDREVWTFEVGQTARYTDKTGRERLGDFSVEIIVLDDHGRPRIFTDLTRTSSHDWTDPIFWAGDFEILRETTPREDGE